MPTVKDVMTPSCKWISPESSLADAAKLMKDEDIGFLAVGEHDRLIGTLTDRDIVTRLVASKRDAYELPVRDAMSKKLFYCFDDQDIDAATQNMATMQIRRLPVVNRAKRLVGVVSLSDLAKYASPTVFTNAFKQICSKPAKIGIRPANIA